MKVKENREWLKYEMLRRPLERQGALQMGADGSALVWMISRCFGFLVALETCGVGGRKNNNNNLGVWGKHIEDLS